MIDLETGDSVALFGPLNHLSPNQKFFVSYCLYVTMDMGINGFVVYEIKNKNLVPIIKVQPENWGPNEIRWKGDTLLIERVFAPDTVQYPNDYIAYYGHLENFKNPNPRLLAWSKNFVFSDGPQIEEEYGGLEKFFEKHFEVGYKGDTIFAEAIQYVNECGDAEGTIKINKSVITLSTHETKDILCSSGAYYLFKYVMLNPSGKRYEIGQTKK